MAAESEPAVGEAPRYQVPGLTENAKRALDIAVAGTALLILIPLFLLVACTIKVTMPGPIFFSHTRLGRGGCSFPCLKFRTMVTESDAVLARFLKTDAKAAEEWARTQKLTRDPRVTVLGHALRKSSIDEIPQLINVLFGHMSCVGPRPVVAAELDRYGPKAALYKSVRPGITGLWQISGRSSLTYEQRIEIDCRYINNRSFFMDLIILWKTIPAVFKTKNTF